MKEIIAIIRPKKVIPTKKALEALGFYSVTAIPVIGRGKQRGIAAELDISIRLDALKAATEAGKKFMEYIPKRMFSIVARDEDVDMIVRAIMRSNQTAQIGDGKIFICPVEDALCVRTGETGDNAVM